MATYLIDDDEDVFEHYSTIGKSGKLKGKKYIAEDDNIPTSINGIGSDLQASLLKINKDNKKRKGSSDGSNEDVDKEQIQFFFNEEKMIRNHMRLNIIFHVIQIAVFVASAIVFDWTHVSLTDEEYGKRTYHVSLLLISEEDSVL